MNNNRYLYIMKILIVDDNKSVLRALKLILEPEFGQVVTVNNPQLIPALLSGGDVDTVLLDMNFNAGDLDGKDGLFWLERIKKVENSPAVVMITAFGEVEIAVEAMKLGAEDFVTKPWDNETLIITLHKAIAKNRKRISDSEMIREADAFHKEKLAEKDMSLDEIKAAHIRRVVDECSGNLSQASQILGINRQTLYNQLKKDK